MKSFFYTKSELKKLGVKKIGKNFQISKKVSIYSNHVVIGNNVRIDDDVCIKGIVEIKDFVHICRGCTLSGGQFGIYIDEFTAISNFSQFFCNSDNYNSSSIPISSITINKNKIKNIIDILSGPIKIGKCCIVGPFNIVLPNTILGSFSATQPHSVLYKKIGFGTILKKNEIKKKNIKEMKKKLLALKKYLKK